MIGIMELSTSLELGLIYGVAAIGIFLSFRIIDFPDLTCDGSFVLGAAVAAMLIKAGFNPMVALLFAGVAGAIAGMATGLIHIYFKMTNLLSGILVAFMLYSINLKVMHGMPNLSLINANSIFSGGYELFVLAIIAVSISLICGFILSTDFGLAIRSLGQNKRLALNCGVKISTMTLFGLALSNALIGISGGLFTQHQAFADISQGLGTVIIGLAAVMIGEKLLPSRSMWISLLACLLGSILYRLLVALALHSEWLGLETQDLNLITGLLIIAIMLAPPLRRAKQLC